MVWWQLFIYQEHLLRGPLQLCILPPAHITLDGSIGFLKLNPPGSRENSPLGVAIFLWLLFLTLSMEQSYEGCQPPEGCQVHRYFHRNFVKSHCAAPAEIQFDSILFWCFPHSHIVLELCQITIHREYKSLVRHSGRRGLRYKGVQILIGHQWVQKIKISISESCPRNRGRIIVRILVSEIWARLLGHCFHIISGSFHSG